MTDSESYAFDVLGELFFGSRFGFMEERNDVGNYMKAIHSICIRNTIAGTLPSYLSQFTAPALALFNSTFREAISTIIKLAVASKTAMDKRMGEIEEEKDDRRDMLRKLVELSADRGNVVNFTTSHIHSESHSSL